MRNSKTYFEQIPVEVVKKIVEELPEKEDIGNDNEAVETPRIKAEPYFVGTHLHCRNGI
jgi:hypothetical protein